MPVAFKAFHWQPVRKTKKMAFMALRGSTGGLWQPSGCGLPGGNKGSIFFHRASEIRHWSSEETLGFRRVLFFVCVL
jgi:hypothetical protein